MKDRKIALWLVVAGVLSLFFGAAIYAAATMPDVIEMKDPAYAKHTKGIVQFSHKKHTEEYKAACGDCHHDAQGKPLTDLKEGCTVQKCIECHKKADYVTGKAAKDLSDQQQREYHANAVHDNCKGCHKEHNDKYKADIKAGKVAKAPFTCTECHPKE